jgi:uracil-DNA glycosylase
MSSANADSSAEAALAALTQEVRGCRICAAHLPLGPRPVFQGSVSARLLIIGQAPGSKVHASGVPWDDASGERLRSWLGMDAGTFHDPKRIAAIPVGLCYPGRQPKGGDAPPRRECAPAWHARLLDALPNVRLTLLVGSYAQAYVLGPGRMLPRVQQFRSYLPRHFPLPHPSWRVAIWLKRNPWFSEETIPALQAAVKGVLT